MKLAILLVFMPFIFGMIISNVISKDIGSEKPFDDRGQERISPFDRVKNEQIFVYDDRLVLNIKHASLAEYADTNSMDPLLDVGSIGIEIRPKNENDLHVGDVVAYETDIGLIVHRITSINYDSEGKYFTLKGDNNYSADPYKVRFNQIKYVLIGIIY